MQIVGSIPSIVDMACSMEIIDHLVSCVEMKVPVRFSFCPCEHHHQNDRSDEVINHSLRSGTGWTLPVANCQADQVFPDR